jgi:hypothetical protein
MFTDKEIVEMNNKILEEMAATTTKIKRTEPVLVSSVQNISFTTNININVMMFCSFLFIFVYFIIFRKTTDINNNKNNNNNSPLE